MSTAYALWNGAQITAGFEFTFSPGIEPSTCVINSPPHSTGLDQFGTLVLQFNGGVTLSFPDALLERPRLSVGNVQMWQLPIRDRRWKWKYGHISGSYNVKQPDETLLREKTPQELAAMLLDAMGESGYSVGSLPNNARPEVGWDYSNPAQELARLCDSLGCVVVLNPLANRVVIHSIGSGGNLPDGPTKGGGIGFDAPAKPSSLMMVGAPVLFEDRFDCSDPVGIDIDGSVKPLNSLSYTPDGGWATTGLYFAEDDITGVYTDPVSGQERKICDLASSCVWRMYRITGRVLGGWSPPLLANTPDAPQTFKDIELTGERIAKHTIPPDNAKVRQKASLHVHAYGEKETAEGNLRRVFRDGFSIDSERQLIQFSQPQYLLNETTGLYSAAEVELWSSYRCKRDGKYFRYTRERTLGGSLGTKPRIEIKEELKQEVTDGADNAASVHTQADYYLDAIENEYTPQDSQTVRYVGIFPLSPDGKIRQVSWSASQSGHFTTVSIAREHNLYVESWEDRKRKAKVDRDTADFDKVLAIMQRTKLMNL
jgi:hypothetical protein